MTTDSERVKSLYARESVLRDRSRVIKGLLFLDGGLTVGAEAFVHIVHAAPQVDYLALALAVPAIPLLIWKYRTKQEAVRIDDQIHAINWPRTFRFRRPKLKF